MKAFIVTEGGRGIGFGHLTRCISIAQGFEIISMHPELIVNGDETIIDLLKGRSHRMLGWLKKEGDLFGIIKGADIVILDSYSGSRKFYEKIAEAAKVSAYMDDYKRIEYPKGVVINSALCANELSYPKKGGAFYLLGAKYAPLRKEYWDVPAKNINKKITSVMVTFGGDDSRSMTAKALKFLKEEYPNIIKNVIISKISRDIKEIENLKDSSINLVHHPDALGMREVMMSSDIAISAGGQTLYELAIVGVPTIAVNLFDNQMNNIKGWLKAGFIEYAGRWGDKSILKNIKTLMEKLSDEKTRLDKYRIGRNSLDGKGALRLSEYLIRVALRERVRGGGDHTVMKIELEKVTDDDSKSLWLWRNHPEVRKNCFDQEEVSWEGHKKWFDAKINSADTAIYIARTSEDKVGVIRFDIDRRYVKVSVNLNPDFFGKGLGSEIILLGTRKFLAEKKASKPVIAEIKTNNMVSQKAFEKAGYRRVKESGEKVIYENTIV